MQVSKLLVLFCLAILAAVLYIATPAIALEHPWEEGESPGGSSGEVPGTANPNPEGDSIQTPLLTGTTQGTFFWWFELVLNPGFDNNVMQSSSVVTPADTRNASSEHRNQSNGNMR